MNNHSIVTPQRAVPRPALETAQDSEELLILYGTHDYEKFSLILINRPVNEKRVLKLANRIKEGKNYLRHYPILVNTRLEIIDGQHRHAAARMTGETLYYLIDDALSVEIASDAVGNTANWSMKDRLNSFAERGFGDYRILREFWAQHPWLPISVLPILCSSKTWRSDSFKNGHYHIDRMDYAQRVVAMANDFKRYVHFAHTRPFLGTLMNLASNPDYDHKTMLQKMEYQSSKLVQCATVEQYLDIFSNIYNYRSARHNQVFFKEAYRRREKNS